MLPKLYQLMRAAVTLSLAIMFSILKALFNKSFGTGTIARTHTKIPYRNDAGLGAASFSFIQDPLKNTGLFTANSFAMQSKLRLLLMTFSVILLSFTTNLVYAQTTATVQTDKLDYPPGSTVVITGTGFQAGEQVQLQVLHYDANGDNDTSAAHQPWMVTAASDGTISATWMVPLDQDELGATLKLTADGQSSLIHAESMFTDANTITITTNKSWSQLTGGSGPGGAPNNTDAIIINSGVILTMDVAGACASLSTASGTATLAGPNSLSVTNSVTILSGTTLTLNTNVSATTLNTQAISGYTGTINGTGTLTLSGRITFGDPGTGSTTSLTISNKTITAGFDYTSFSGGANGTRTETIQINSGIIAFNNLNNSTNLKGTTPVFTYSSGTLEYDFSAGINASATEWPSSNAPSSVIINGNVTAPGPRSINTLTIGNVTANSVFNDGGNQITSTGTLNLTSGTFKLGNNAVATTFPAFSINNIATGTTVEYASGVAQIVSNTPSYSNLTLSGGGTKTLAAGTLTIGGDWSIANNTAGGTNNPTINLSGNLNLSSGTFTATSGTFSVGGNWTNTATFAPNGGNVIFNGAGTQTLSPGPSAFNNVNHTGAGLLKLSGANLNVSGTFTNSGGNFDANGFANNVTGLTTLSGGNYLAGTTQQSFNGGLTISGGTYTGLAGTAGNTIATNVTISSGTLSAPGSTGTFNVSGNWSNSATFTHNNGTVTFNNSTNGSTQTLSGNTTFYNLSFGNTGVTTDFGSGTTTIANNFSGTGGSMTGTNASFVFTGNSGAINGITVKNFKNLSINSGASTSVSGGNVTITTLFTNDGTYNQTSGTTFLSGSQTLAGTNAGSTTFNNLTIQGSSTVINAGSLDFTINGGVFNSTGTFNGGSKTVSFSGSSSIGNNAGTINFNNVTISGILSNASANKSFNVAGNWANNGTYTAGTENIKFNGSSAQTIGGNNSTTFSNLEIANTPGGVSLTKAQTVSGILTLTSGILTTNATNLLSVTNTSAGAITAGSTTKFISGPVKWSFGAGSYVFPLGKGGTYLPFTLATSAASSPVLTVEAFNTNSGGTADGTTISSISGTEYWSASLISGTFTGSVSLTRQSALTTENVIAKSSTANGTYASIGGTASGTSINASNNISTGGFFVMASTPAKCPSSTSIAPSADQAVCQGTALNQLTATVTTSGSNGNPSFSYQWYYNTTNSNAVSGAIAISGATSSTFTPLSGASEAGTTRYYFVVAYSSGSPCNQTATTQSLASNAVKVTVNTAPTVSATNIIGVNNDINVCGATVSFGSNVAGTGTPAPALTYTIGATTITSPYAFPVGTTTVRVTATNSCGSDSKTFDVTVTDNQNPTITAPSTVSVNADNGSCAATNVALGTPVTGDNCGVANVTNDAPASFPVGNTTVTWTVTDIHGNSATATQTVTVTDNQNPLLSSISDRSENVGTSCSFTIPDYRSLSTITDNCGIDHVTQTPTIGTVISGHNTTQLITITAYDIHGNNQSTLFTITLKDVTVPTITCSGNIMHNTDLGSCSASITVPDPSSSDNCGVTARTWTLNGSTVASSPATGMNSLISYVFNKGVTTITWTVKDAAGNSATCSQTVTVEDHENPIITCASGSPFTRNTNNGVCSYTVSGTEFNPASFGDNCPGAIIKNNFNNSSTLAGAILPKGTTVIIWTVTDASGNTATCSVSVTVVDNQNPVINCPVTSSASRNMNTGVCSYTVQGTEFNATANDNCGVTSLTYSLSGVTTGTGSSLAGVVLNKGVTTITWTAKDAANNTSTCSFTVTVVDNQAPVITCKPGATKFVGVGSAKYTIAGNEFNATATDNCTMQTLAYSLSGATTAVYNVANTSLNGVKLNVGTTTITWQATDVSGNTSSCTTTVVVNKRKTMLVYNNTFGNQYSDAAQPTATLSYNAATNPGDPDSWQPLSGKPVSFAIGDQTASATTLNPSGIATTPLQILQAPGTYSVTATFTEDSSYLGSLDVRAGAFTVTQEDARVEYTGDVIKATASATATSAVVTLRANILDITAVNLAGDPYAGDIRNAKVMFVNRDASNAPISGWIPVSTLVNASDSKVGTVSFDWTVSLGSASDVETNIGIIVDKGYYIRNSEADNVIVTVYQPNGDFITGGGFITNTKSVGSMKADASSKTNFGFNVKFNKKGTQLQGNLNFIFRRTESDTKVHVYQVKSNSMLSLGVNATNINRQTANFLSKCNITDITDPLNPVSVNPGGGVKFMYVNMVDNGEPGSKDSISFVLVSGSGTTPNDPTVLSNIIYSSNWTGTKTEMMNLTGGNLVVHSGFNLGSATTLTTTRQAVAPVMEAGVFSLRAYPNPSNAVFTLQIASSNVREKVQIRVIDLSGKVIEEFSNLTPNQDLKIGSLYRPGVYVVEMIQGSQRKQLKLIKQPD